MSIIYKQEIPVFFSCDDNYIPFLAVSVASIKEHASKENLYKIYVLTDGLTEKSVEEIKKLETENIKVDFVDVTKKIENIKEDLKVSLRDYYTVPIFYRMFIASLFPNYKKAIYLDSDVVLLTDIAEFYNTDIKDNILGVVADQVVAANEQFIVYVNKVLGVDAKKYFNSGVLLMNLEEYRKQKTEETFIEILTKFNPESVAPDQDYLNVLCKDKVYYFGAEWNKMPMGNDDNVSNEFKLIHYNMYNKPWYYEGVPCEEHFWHYAKSTDYYEALLNRRANYSDEAKERDAKSGEILLNNALRICKNEINFRIILEKYYGRK